ncbi:hypothetical protein ACMZ8B_05755 [Gardnerella greenwoodii]
MQTKQQQTPGKYTANVVKYRRNNNKRRENTRQMWSNADKTKTNARKIHGKCSQIQPKQQQTPGKYTANVVKCRQNNNKRQWLVKLSNNHDMLTLCMSLYSKRRLE